VGMNGTNPEPLMRAYGANSVTRLTSLSHRQLRVWDAAGVFPPSLGREDYRGRPYFIYSFRDLVGLCTLARLRQEHGIAPAELRRFGAWLTRMYQEPWSSVRFAVAGKRVLYGEPGAALLPCPDEPCVEYDTMALARQTAAETYRLQERTPEQIGVVTRNRNVLHGKPALAGTRIPTTAVWDYHQAGYGTAAILELYPRLTEADVRAALAYEADNRRGNAVRQRGAV